LYERIFSRARVRSARTGLAEFESTRIQVYCFTEGVHCNGVFRSAVGLDSYGATRQSYAIACSSASLLDKPLHLNVRFGSIAAGAMEGAACNSLVLLSRMFGGSTQFVWRSLPNRLAFSRTNFFGAEGAYIPARLGCLQSSVINQQQLV